VAALLMVTVQVAVIWSIGAEPGLFWRTEPLVFALLLQFIGIGAGGRMVVARGGAPSDRGSRRLMAALVLGACTVARRNLCCGLGPGPPGGVGACPLPARGGHHAGGRRGGARSAWC
jgi:hypothetical protein